MWIFARTRKIRVAFESELRYNACTSIQSNIIYMSDNIESQVIDVIVEQLGVDREKVTPEAKFIDDLGADSLDTVELVMSFEEKFSVDVPDEDAEKLKSVSDVVAYIKEKKQD